MKFNTYLFVLLFLCYSNSYAETQIKIPDRLRNKIKKIENPERNMLNEDLTNYQNNYNNKKQYMGERKYIEPKIQSNIADGRIYMGFGFQLNSLDDINLSSTSNSLSTVNDEDTQNEESGTYFSDTSIAFKKATTFYASIGTYWPNGLRLELEYGKRKFDGEKGSGINSFDYLTETFYSDIEYNATTANIASSITALRNSYNTLIATTDVGLTNANINTAISSNTNGDLGLCDTVSVGCSDDEVNNVAAYEESYKEFKSRVEEFNKLSGTFELEAGSSISVTDGNNTYTIFRDANSIRYTLNVVNNDDNNTNSAENDDIIAKTGDIGAGGTTYTFYEYAGTYYKVDPDTNAQTLIEDTNAVLTLESLMANLIFENLNFNGKFLPYIGFGIGFSRSDFSAFSNNGNDQALSYQGLLGISMKTSDNTSLYLGYKYFITESLEQTFTRNIKVTEQTTGSSKKFELETIDSVESYKFKEQSLNLGFRVFF